jgi:TrmH family RNA methyltransferase
VSGSGFSAVCGRLRDGYADPASVILEGFHALKHALRFAAEVELAVCADRAAALDLARRLAPDLLDGLTHTLIEVGQDGLRTVCPTSPPPTGIIALARRPHVDVTALLEPATAPILLLDRPAHLGNVGAAIRVAAAAGLTGVLTTGRHDPWHASAVRGSAGLHFALPVARTPIVPASTRPLVALAPQGQPLMPEDLPDDALLAFGSERDGLDPALLARAELRVALPMRPGVSSLNLATAVAAVTYARIWARRRERSAATERASEPVTIAANR